MTEYAIYNGTLLPKKKILISPDNRGMMYGDGCFDTLRSYKGKFLNLEAHFERTKAAAEYLGITVHFDYEGFRYKILELLEANNQLNEDVIIRVQCWRAGHRGYATNSSQAEWLTTSLLHGAHNAAIKLATVKTRAIPSVSLARTFKLSNGLNYIQAAREAKAKDADDALTLTLKGKISETTIANIFWVKHSTVYTPSVNCDLFPGITRTLIKELIRQNESLSLKEGEFELNNILNSEAVFITNSIREIQPVRSVDQKKFEEHHPIVDLLKEDFEKYKSEHLS